VGASVKRGKNGVGDTGLFDEELCSQFWTVWDSWVKNGYGKRGEVTGCSEPKENIFAKNSPIFPQMTSASSSTIQTA
jgi:hypothetical protein